MQSSSDLNWGRRESRGKGGACLQAELQYREIRHVGKEMNLSNFKHNNTDRNSRENQGTCVQLTEDEPCYSCGKCSL